MSFILMLNFLIFDFFSLFSCCCGFWFPIPILSADIYLGFWSAQEPICSGWKALSACCSNKNMQAETYLTLPRHSLQVFQGSIKAFPSWPREVISPVIPHLGTQKTYLSDAWITLNGWYLMLLLLFWAHHKLLSSTAFKA